MGLQLAVMASLGEVSREEANRLAVGEIFGRLDATAASVLCGHSLS